MFPSESGKAFNSRFTTHAMQHPFALLLTLLSTWSSTFTRFPPPENGLSHQRKRSATVSKSDR